LPSVTWHISDTFSYGFGITNQGAFRKSSYEEITVMRKRNLLFSGYHARLRAINPDFFPALSDVAADPRPGFDLEAELCSQVVSLVLKKTVQKARKKER
jgi:hypothetical protein